MTELTSPSLAFGGSPQTSPLRRDPFSSLPASTTEAPAARKPSSFDAIDRAALSTPSALPDATIAAAHEAKLAQKVDSAFDAANAPYEITTPSGEKVTVRAPPQFRMVGGVNYHADKHGNCTDGPPLLKALGKHAGKLMNEVNRVLAGRGSTEDVAKITRALIENGHLGPVDPRSAPAAIQALQWKYGVGIDCAGYVQRAFFAARGKTGTPAERQALGLGSTVNENFGNLASNPKWKSVPVTSARPGDVMVLGPPKGDTVGHKVLVRSNKLITADAKAKLGLTSSGPWRMIEVDSSWGAGQQGKDGGVQRRVWLYDESKKSWSTYDPASHKVKATPDGPYDHPLVGIYRPKGEL